MIPFIIGAIIVIIFGSFLSSLVNKSGSMVSKLIDRFESPRIKYIKKSYPEAYKYLSRNAPLSNGRELKKNLLELSDEQLNRVNERQIQLRKNQEQIIKDKEWAEEQCLFANNYKSNLKLSSSGFKTYSYKIKVTTITEYGEDACMEMDVVQHYLIPICKETTLNYKNAPLYKNNLKILPEIKKQALWKEDQYQKIASGIKALRGDDTTLLFFNCDIKEWEYESLRIYYDNIIKHIGCNNVIISNPGISITEALKKWEDIPGRNIIIVDMETENESMIANCKIVFEKFRKYCPLINYISIIKCLDRREMRAIISEADSKVKEKKRKKLELIEKVRKEEENAYREEQAPTILAERAKKWDYLDDNFYYTWFLDYYPTTCDFEATEDEWNDRFTIWNFKNDPSKEISKKDHNEVLERVIPQIKQRLIDTFGEDYLKYITLFCIPASTREKHEARYEEFSKRLCRTTGMKNGYEYIDILKDGISKNDPQSTTGKSINPKISIDIWFKEKNVLLFDDVITKGNTMIKYKNFLERNRANVIGGFALGRTKHERPPQPHRSRVGHIPHSPEALDELPF